MVSFFTYQLKNVQVCAILFILFLWWILIYQMCCMLSHFSWIQLCATLWTVVHQAPLSMGFSRQEYWSGLPCPPPGGLPDPGMEREYLMSPVLAGGFFTTSTTWETPVYRQIWHRVLCGGYLLTFRRTPVSYGAKSEKFSVSGSSQCAQLRRNGTGTKETVTLPSFDSRELAKASYCLWACFPKCKLGNKAAFIDCF